MSAVAGAAPRVFTDLGGRNEPPLPQWDKPKPGEPAHGYVVRLGALNRRPSVSVMLASHGLNGISLQPAECLAFAKSFPIQGRDELAQATPVVFPNRVTIMGQEVRRKHWQLLRRRFCPACLAEQAYHRAWWDLPSFARCPYHDLDLEWRDPSGRPLPWWSPSFTHGPTGKGILRFGIPRNQRPTPSFEAYLLGRLGVEEVVPVPLLDALPTLGEAIEMVEFMGRIVLGGTDRRRPTVDATPGFELGTVMKAGYPVTTAGRDGVLELLRGVADHRARMRAGRGRGASFGWIDQLREEEDSAHRSLVDELLLQVVVERGQFSTATSQAWRRGVEGWLSVPRLAQELGITEIRLRRIAEKLGIHERQFGSARSRYRAFSPEQAEQVRSTLRRLVGRDEAAALLGVTRSCFDALVANGDISVFCIIGKFGSRDRFDPEELARFADGILRHATRIETAPPETVRFGLLNRTCKTNPSHVLGPMVRSYGPILVRVGDKLGDLLVAQPRRHALRTSGQTSAARAALAKLPGLGRYQAATLYGDRVHVIDALCEQGEIEAVASERKAWRRLSAESVEAVCRSWAPTTLYAEVPELAGRHVPSQLRARGVRLLDLPLSDGSSTVAVNRASARKVLRLPCDPDAKASGSVRAFEAAFLHRLAERNEWSLAGRERGLSLRTGKGDLRATVVLDADRDVVEISARAKRIDPPTRVNEWAVSREGTFIRLTRSLPAPAATSPSAWPAIQERILARLSEAKALLSPP
ncbi:TniQ family protein [Enterovirga sp. CN4-39]|uniref:TniQ family protein n=1 Tax=Enterovirga sp. CN4-39 TaxID=3400910 RepID=UPI003C1082C7